ncbi:MAG: alpha/beta fold hydrolase [Cyclobacteriaceae bacterium]
MPVIENPQYSHPHLMFNGHMQTVLPAIFRNPKRLAFDRERISTPDGDFLDLDWLSADRKQLVIISHGLEENSQRPYMAGMAKVFFDNGFDVVNWNFRGCSGEMNKKPVFYHSGATYDLGTVVSHVHRKYDHLYLIGFSLGGNLTLKYLGENHGTQQAKIRKAVTISVPLDLASSSQLLSSRENRLYSLNFLISLKQKIRQKSLIFPELINAKRLKVISTIIGFDDHYTAPLHGFINAEDYYQQCSSLFILEKIKIPTLILNAENDPFLSQTCYPKTLGSQMEMIYMEFPKHGGHVGFCPRSRKERYWSEKRAIEFIQMKNYS